MQGCLLWLDRETVYVIAAWIPTPSLFCSLHYYFLAFPTALTNTYTRMVCYFTLHIIQFYGKSIQHFSLTYSLVLLLLYLNQKLKSKSPNYKHKKLSGNYERKILKINFDLANEEQNCLQWWCGLWVMSTKSLMASKLYHGHGSSALRTKIVI